MGAIKWVVRCVVPRGVVCFDGVRLFYTARTALTGIPVARVNDGISGVGVGRRIIDGDVEQDGGCAGNLKKDSDNPRKGGEYGEGAEKALHGL